MWLGSIGSNIGTTMNDTAAVWTMTTMTSSPLLVSLMQTMSSLPLFLLALPAGALADLVDRRRLILIAQTGALFTAVGMALLAWYGALTQTLLLLATFQLGVAAAFTLPAWQALIPEVVGREQLSPAIALNGVGFNIARSLGPILGGLLLAALGPAPVFALNALSFVAVIGVMCTGSYIATPRSAQQEQMLGAMVGSPLSGVNYNSGTILRWYMPANPNFLIDTCTGQIQTKQPFYYQTNTDIQILDPLFS
jgi:MFS family permease